MSAAHAQRWQVKPTQKRPCARPPCASPFSDRSVDIMKFINLTPHAVSIRNEAGEEVLALPPSGAVARVAEQREALGLLAGIEISRASYGAAEGLPEPRPGVAYIVSALVLAA